MSDDVKKAITAIERMQRTVRQVYDQASVCGDERVVRETTTDLDGLSTAIELLDNQEKTISELVGMLENLSDELYDKCFKPREMTCDEIERRLTWYGQFPLWYDAVDIPDPVPVLYVGFSAPGLPMCFIGATGKITAKREDYGVKWQTWNLRPAIRLRRNEDADNGTGKTNL